MDFVLFDHQLLLNRSNDIDYKEGIIKSTISLMNFLKKNDLLIGIDPFNEDGSIKENIVIRKSNLTDEGFQLFLKPVNNWWDALDRGTPPEKVTILENGLKKIRAANKYFVLRGRLYCCLGGGLKYSFFKNFSSTHWAT